MAGMFKMMFAEGGMASLLKSKNGGEQPSCHKFPNITQAWPQLLVLYSKRDKRVTISLLRRTSSLTEELRHPRKRRCQRSNVVLP